MVRLIKKESYSKRYEYYNTTLNINDLEKKIYDKEDIASLIVDSKPLDDFNKLYSSTSKDLTISKAEEVLGKRPSINKPKTITANNPRPETVQKYIKDVQNYKTDVEECIKWNEDYKTLLDLNNKLDDIHDKVDSLLDRVQQWKVANNGIFLVYKSGNQYGRIDNPLNIVEDMIDTLGIPEEIKSITNDSWIIDKVEVLESKTATDLPIKSIEVSLDDMSCTIVSIIDDINMMTHLIDYSKVCKNLQPKDILRLTYAKPDMTTEKTLKSWSESKTNNYQLDEDGKELKKYILSSCILMECQQVKRYPNTSTISPLLVSLFSEQGI